METMYAAPLLFALVCWAIGHNKGRDVFGLLLGLFFGPIGLIVILLASDPREKCPHCGGYVNKNVTCCCHCGRELVARRVPKVTCPMCGQAIARASLHKGENQCPSCGESFSV